MAAYSLPPEPDPHAPTYAHGPFQELVGYEILDDPQGSCFRLPVRRDHINHHGVRILATRSFRRSPLP
jgi:hypothetical protein